LWRAWVISFKTTDLFSRLGKAILSKKYRYFGLQGGTSSSKTWTDVEVAILSAENDTTPTLTSIVAESVPHLKRGAIKDFFTIMDTDKSDPKWNSTDMRYTFPSGSVIEFFSADDASKLRGARRERLILNEANNITYTSATQLMIRTKEWIIADWNPEVKFWWHNHIKPLEDAWFDISTHWDNPFLDVRIRNAIEAKKLTDPEWYRVYGEGQIGQYEGIVFRNVEIADLSQVINSFDQLYYGGDFGYFPDPFAFIVVAKRGNNLYILRELVANNLDNEQIAQLCIPYAGNNICFWDSAEPKSIRELKKYGLNGARGVAKGADSRKYRINWLKGHNLIIDKSCRHLAEEVESFSRIKDKKTGEILPLFQDGNDHCIDALCYALSPVMYQGTSIESKNIPV